MDPNVAKYQKNSNPFYYTIQRYSLPENNTFHKPSFSNGHFLESHENRNCNTIHENSTMHQNRRTHESVIKNYKFLKTKPANLNNVSEHPNTFAIEDSHFEKLRCGNAYTSVIQSTNQYTAPYQHNQQAINDHHISKTIQNSNYFCKKLPDFSNMNMEYPHSNYKQISRVTSNQKFLSFSSKISDCKAEYKKTATNPSFTSYSSNNTVISNYHNIPQNSQNTQRISRNVTMNSTKNVMVHYTNINAQNYNMNDKLSCSSIPEYSYSSCSSKVSPMLLNGSKNMTHRNSSIAKPNYKEMISQAYSLKKTMTERELNMKIIQRTLLSNNTQHLESNTNCSYLKFSELVSSPLLDSSHFPLDLSIKSIKTSADSTESDANKKKTFKQDNKTPSVPKLDILPIVSQTAEKLLNSGDGVNSAINLTTNYNLSTMLTNDSSSLRIRTKGELKVFNPNSTKLNKNMEENINPTKELYTIENEMQNINLFDWDNTCNKLLNQLETAMFHRPNSIENCYNEKYKNALNAKKLLKRKHRRELFNKKRLVVTNCSSSEDESIGTMKFKRLQSFRRWRKRRQHFFRSRNNNNNNNKINKNLQEKIFDDKEPQSIHLTEEEYKESEDDLIKNSSDIPSSISEKTILETEKNNLRKVLKIAGMVTRSQSLLTKNKFNLRKRFNSTQSNDKKSKKIINRKINGNRKKMVNSNIHHKIIIKNKSMRSTCQQIDWEVELIKDGKSQYHISTVEERDTEPNRPQSSKSNIAGKFYNHINKNKDLTHRNLTSKENELNFENNIVSKDEPTAHSSFERKYEEYICNVYNDSFENVNKITINKKKPCTRRKPSSGFDYIRKKKRVKTALSSLPLLNSIQKSKLLRKSNNKMKTEKDIHLEIHKWVLNKSVGQTTLHKAARLGYIDVVCYCLERLKLNPNVKDNAGYTPLHEACSRGFLDIARCLLLYGANFSEAAHSGIRPIHEASESGSMEIVRLLLQYGADPQITTYNGKSPYMLAENSSLQRYMETFLKDLQNISNNKQPCQFYGPWHTLEADDEMQFEEHFSSIENIIELEECDTPLPPLYELKHIRDNSKWMILSDLSNLLQIKSKDKLLKYLYPSVPSTTIQKDLTMEIKMNDFIENAVCLQLLHAGEKINIQSSKFTLVKYNDIVRNVLKISKSVITL